MPWTLCTLALRTGSPQKEKLIMDVKVVEFGKLESWKEEEKILQEGGGD